MSAVSAGRVLELLWPERTEQVARNNLVQLLKRMRAVFGAELVTGGEGQNLAAVEVDVHVVLENGTAAELLEGTLPDGLCLGGSLNLADWLMGQRERLGTRQTRRTAQAASVAEERGDLEEALRLARRVLTLSSLSEDAQRRLMRLLYLRGEPRRALEAYAAFRDQLAQALHTQPMPRRGNSRP